MHPLRMEMILFDRGFDDIVRMHEYLASGGTEQAIYQLFDTKLYFKDGIVPGEEGFIETIKNAWKWLKEKVRAIVDTILSCFGIKRSSGNPSSSNSDSNSVSDSDVSGTIDVKKVDKLRSEIGKTVKILNKSYDSLTTNAGGDLKYVEDIESQLRDRYEYGLDDADKKMLNDTFSGELIPDDKALEMLFNLLKNEKDGFSIGGSLNKSYVTKSNELEVYEFVMMTHQVYLLMFTIDQIKNTLLEHTKTIDEKLKTDPNSPDQIIKCTKQLIEFVDNTLRYVEIIPNYLDMSLPIWKDFGKAVENIIRGAKTIIKIPREK